MHAIRVVLEMQRIHNAAIFAVTAIAVQLWMYYRLQDIQLLLAAQCHLGTKNCDYQMERYIYKRRNDGIYIINLGKTWEKLQLAARVIVAIENPQDIVVQSARPYGQRAILKFAHYVNAKALSGRHTPGEPLTGVVCWSPSHSGPADGQQMIDGACRFCIRRTGR
jgi:Ribosomal protein S2